MIDLSGIEGFDWDEGNIHKNWLKHNVSSLECEEVFFDSYLKIVGEKLYSGNEVRFIILGKTKKGRLLFVVFTLRNNKIRVISARDINKKEKKLYEEAT